MSLDQVTLSLATAVVVVVSAVFFLTETVLRRDEDAGRIWSLAFLAAMLTTLVYAVWAYEPSVEWPIAVGNATFVTGTGCMWLGCRRFNGRPMAAASIAVAAAAAAATAAVLLAGPHGGSWAGALWMFACLLVFAALGAIECRRGDMSRYRTSWGLAVVLGLQAVFYVGRIVVVLTTGFDSALFSTWFGTATTSFLTIVLTIVALVVTSVLRADRAALRGLAPATPTVTVNTGGILPRSSFLPVLMRLLDRAAPRGDLIAVVSVRMEDLPQIAMSFGGEVAAAISDAARTAVLRHVSPVAVIADDGMTGMTLALLVSSESDARRQALMVYRGLLDDLAGVAGGVIPVVGIGIGLSSPGHYDPQELVAVARDAAHRAALSVESSVLVGIAGVSAP